MIQNVVLIHYGDLKLDITSHHSYHQGSFLLFAEYRPSPGRLMPVPRNTVKQQPALSLFSCHFRVTLLIV